MQYQSQYNVKRSLILLITPIAIGVLLFVLLFKTNNVIDFVLSFLKVTNENIDAKQKVIIVNTKVDIPVENIETTQVVETYGQDDSIQDDIVYNILWGIVADIDTQSLLLRSEIDEYTEDSASRIMKVDIKKASFSKDTIFEVEYYPTDYLENQSYVPKKIVKDISCFLKGDEVTITFPEDQTSSAKVVATTITKTVGLTSAVFDNL